MTFFIAVCNKTIVAFSFVVLFKRGRSLVIALSLPIALWPLKKSDCPLVAPLDHVHAIEYAV